MHISQLYKNHLLKKDHKITLITDNSKEVIQNSIFVAIKGYTVDGYDFIEEAIKNGASTIITNRKFQTDASVNVIIVNNPQKELAFILNKMYGSKLKKFKLIGITGTNGKTTCCTLLYQYLLLLKESVICFTSNGNYVNSKFFETKNTTPKLLTIYNLILNSHLNNGFVIIEISSQAINEMRILGLNFDLITITNITHDHLDYHDNLTDYFYTKARLLFQTKNNGVILLNSDSPYYSKLNLLSPQKTYSFGKSDIADFKYEVIETSIDQTLFFINDLDNINALKTNLLGEVNVQNITTVYSIISILNLPCNKFTEFIQRVPRIKGRMNVYSFDKRTIIIDYAHTPDAVEKILLMVKNFKISPIKLLIGCGGNRDRLKRPIIGKIACANADYVYFTEDNSRDENTSKIIKEIICDVTTNNYTIIESRFSAIKKMIKDSSPGDILVLLGMGIDKSYIEKQEYSDLDMALLAFKELSRVK